MTPTRIAGFEALPDEDAPAGTRYRALRADAAFRYVDIGTSVDGDAYDVVHEDGEPDGAEGATVIEFFEVPAGEDDAFLAGCHQARAVLADQRGYLGTRLHRSVGPAAFRFVAVTRWSSPLMVARAAGRPDWQAAAGLPFSSRAALYNVVP